MAKFSLPIVIEFEYDCNFDTDAQMHKNVDIVAR